MKTKTLVLTLLLPFTFCITPLVSFAQWYQQTSGTTLGLNDVCFRNFNKINYGWAVGSEGIILHTADGGYSWNDQVCNMDYGDYNFRDVHFINPDRGWIAGSRSGYPPAGLLLQTINGGDSWMEAYNDTVYWLTDVFFTDSINGWLIANYDVWMTKVSLILHSTDGGWSWGQQLGYCHHFFQDIFFIDSINGWAVGGGINGSTRMVYSMILYTDDGGTTWEEQLFCYDSIPPLYSVYFQDEYNGWAVGGLVAGYGLFPGSSVILHTTNGGITWEEQISGIEEDWESVYFTDLQTGWIVRTSSILHTTDAGNTWVEQYSGTTAGLNSVCFIEDDGWIAGENGTILHTENGGVVGVESVKCQVSSLKLQCFPNPTDGIMDIRYRIPVGNNLTLSIYDMRGKKIEELVSKEQSPGDYQVRFDASELPAGIYLIRLQIGSKTIVEKIIKL